MTTVHHLIQISLEKWVIFYSENDSVIKLISYEILAHYGVTIQHSNY